MTVTVYWVSPLFGSWDVRRAGKVLSHHERKRDAVCAAARLARADRPSLLKVQRRDGSVESSRSYGAVGAPPGRPAAVRRGRGQCWGVEHGFDRREGV
ncbi:MAG TPA: DUF2188 domain-containing protein [Amycolatopsis sp.]|nr:DUF2188 domain-containing protein [Amycolatopsis sp.]